MTINMLAEPWKCGYEYSEYKHLQGIYFELYFSWMVKLSIIY